MATSRRRRNRRDSLYSLPQALYIRTASTGATLTVYGHIKAQSNGVNWPLYINTVIGTLAVDGWAVTFGTAMRGPAHPSTASVLTLNYSKWQSNSVAWHSGRTSVFDRRTFHVLRSTCSWPLMWVNRPLYRSANQADSTFHPLGVDKWVIGCNLSLGRRHLVNAYEVEAGIRCINLQVKETTVVKLCDPYLSALSWV